MKPFHVEVRVKLLSAATALVVFGMTSPASGQSIVFENVNVIPMDRERVLAKHRRGDKRPYRACRPRHATSREEEDRRVNEIAQLTARAGVWNVTTMYLWDLFHNAETGEALRKRLTETRFLPRSMIDEWVKSKNSRLSPPNNTPGE